MRTTVYVDGFNLYYGAVKDTPYKWLDLQRYFVLLLQTQDLTVKYFTAPIVGSHRPNQDAYIAALRTLPGVQVFVGDFMMKRVLCRRQGCRLPKADRFFSVPEEKQTDVGLAIEILKDAQAQTEQRLAVVSGDSDLVPAFRAAKSICPNVRLCVYVPSQFPKRRYTQVIADSVDKIRDLPLGLLVHAQLPPSVLTADGNHIAKPASW